MIKSKIVDTLITFNQSEFKSFGRFVISPYFNSSKSVIKLYNYLKKFYPDFDNKKFTPENAYNYIFPGNKLNSGTLRKLFSDLQSQAEEFLSYSNLESKNQFQKKLALLLSLDEKKLDKQFLLKINELENIYRTGDNFDDDFFINNFELEVIRLNFNLGIGRAGFAPHSVYSDLQKCTTFLIGYILIMSFKLSQDLSVISLSSDDDKTNTLVYKFLETLGPVKFLDTFKQFAPEYYSIIAIYLNRYMISLGFDYDDKYYWKLKELVLKNIEHFTRLEKYNLMLFLENSCDEKIYDNRSFDRELHDIHITMLTTGLYNRLETDFFSLIRFRKMILTALRIKEFEWARIL